MAVFPPPFPVTMRGVIDRCVLISLRTPAEAVRSLVPRGLRLRTAECARTGEVFAFWNIVLCHIERMRPFGIPRRLGVSYHHIAYRLNVEAERATGPALAGLYFLRSDADSRLICGPGNPVSDFRFHPARVTRDEAADGAERWRISSRDGRGDAEVVIADREPLRLAPGSPFASLAEARAFLKYQPTGLAPTRDGRALRLAEVFRNETEWRERPATVVSARFASLEGRGEGAVELATIVEPIAYRWRLGRHAPLTQ